jgi:hypothetical protein
VTPDFGFARIHKAQPDRVAVRGLLFHLDRKRPSSVAQTLATGLEAAGAEEAVGDEASVGEIASVGVAPAAIPTQILTQGAVIITLAGTVLVSGGQYAYDYFHPIQPGWNSSAYSELSPDQKRQVEDSIYHNYGVAR